MRCVALVCVSALVWSGFSFPASANVEAYCEAYAIDFASAAETDEARWQVRREEARSACLLQYNEAPAPIAKAKVKPKAVKPKPVKPVVVARKETAPEKAVPKVAEKPVIAPAVAAKKPNIREGTPEWYDYCARKYTSFSRKTGKYISKTGVERKCLVTADFQ